MLLLAVALAYAPVWHAGFIWDDDAYVTQNVPLRSLAGLWQIWFVPGATEQYYPLANTSFWIEYHLWQLAPLGYHLDNLALQALNAVLIWTLLRKLGVKGAWLAAAIFAVHPVGVESVAWVTERKNTLSGLFFLAALAAGLKAWRLESAAAAADGGRAIPRYYGLTFALYLVALLTKTATAPLPLVILLLVWWKRGRLALRDFVAMIPFLAAGLTMGAVTMWVEKHFVGTQGPGWDLSWMQRSALAGKIFWFYLAKLFWPFPLLFIYPRWELNARHAMTYLPLALAVLVFGLLLRFRRKTGRGILVAFTYDLLLLFPVLGFFKLYFFRYSFVEDHLQYLAAIGPIALAAAGIDRVMEMLPPKLPGIKSLAYATLIFTLGAMTWSQCGMYRDEVTLWRTTIAKNPRCWMAYNNLGTLLTSSGKKEEAAAAFRKAIALHGNYEEAHNNLGTIFLDQGQRQSAEDEFRRALAINPQYALAYNNLGNVCLQKGELDQAAALYNKALALKPNLPGAEANLGLALLREGKVDEAVGHFQSTLALQPDHANALLNLGNALAQKGENDEALACYERAWASHHDDADAAANAGFVLMQKGELGRAISYFQQALALAPRDAAIRNNLGTAFLEAGRIAEAAAQFQASLKIEPDNFGVLNNLAWIWSTCPDASVRNGTEAVELARRADELAGGKNPIVLASLAAAEAETGRDDEACQTAERAIALARAQNNPVEAGIIGHQLECYRRGAPFRDANLAPRPGLHG